MINYCPNEINEIEEIVNNKYLLKTGYSISDLSILTKNYFLTSNPDNKIPNAYIVDFVLKRGDNQINDICIGPFTNKVESVKVAFHIAHDIWCMTDKCQNQQLWYNF